MINNLEIDGLISSLTLVEAGCRKQMNRPSSNQRQKQHLFDLFDLVPKFDQSSAPRLRKVELNVK